MKTGDEVFERSTGAKGRVVSLHDNSVYVLFSNGRRAMLDKSEITFTVEQGTENVIKWLLGTGKKLQRTIEVSILKFMELPLYAVVTISTILLLIGAGVTFLLSMF